MPPLPKFRLDIHDLAHPGAQRLLALPRLDTLLSRTALLALDILYTRIGQYDAFTTLPPATHAVTLTIQPTPGVASTTSSALDPAHKTITLSAGFLASLPPERVTDEVAGVLVHELVHCFQHDGGGACPGGLLEGVADWVRLAAGLAPPHWNNDKKGDKWDAGYATTAYFLESLTERFGADAVRDINAALAEGVYKEREFWVALFGAPVQLLWAEYCAGGVEDLDLSKLGI